MRKTIICAAILASLGGAPASASDPPPLTVAETLGSVYPKYQHASPFYLYRRANLRALPALRKILDDPEQGWFHGRAWLIIGFVGDASDLKRLEARMLGYEGPLQGGQTDAVSGMFDALGLMCERDVKGARALVGKMLEPKYWEGVRFRWYDRPMPQRPPFAYESIIRVMYGYSLSRRPDLKDRVREILDGIEDPMLREQMRVAIASKLLEEHAKNMRANERDQPSEKELDDVASLFNGDIESPGPSAKVPERRP